MYCENKKCFFSSSIFGYIYSFVGTRFYSLHTGNKRVYTVVEISLFYPFLLALSSVASSLE